MKVNRQAWRAIRNLRGKFGPKLKRRGRGVLTSGRSAKGRVLAASRQRHSRESRGRRSRLQVKAPESLR
jgi:hypothetical protein